MKVNELRKRFVDFFKSKGHQELPSSSLIPHNDPTLMFTNAGMVQFKNYFTGDEVPQHTRVVTSQKCVRAGGKHNDLENVGHTARHHTFFEMLGNFSFGDYFKQEAIEYAWEFLTQELRLEKSKLYITVYHNDDEAYDIWQKLTGFDDKKIIRISTDDNFWSMGKTGPCGPCSEIFYDHGENFEGGLPGTPEEDGDRYIEIWNLVFMQYQKLEDGSQIPLPKPCIDTGIGLERLAALMQGKHHNYDIDIFESLVNESKHITGTNDHLTSHRVIADHVRSGAFLLADGVMPSNEGRGYVLRRILRRAMRHAYQIGYKECLLYKLVPTLISEMGESHPELHRAEAAIISTMKLEEEKFRETLGNGLKLLSAETKKLEEGSLLDGTIAFKLYDTYGFPLDLTRDILKSQNIDLDEEGFKTAMQEQKDRARAAWSGSGSKAEEKVWFDVHEECGATEFIGYVAQDSESIVKAIIVDGKLVKEVNNGKAVVVLNQTPFYAESGGQIGDTGHIGKNIVVDTKKYKDGVFGHHITVNEPVKANDVVHSKIDSKKRKLIKANHSATHVLHYVLRYYLGEHVAQKGSLVADDKLRFDFSYNAALSTDDIYKIESQVNDIVTNNYQADTKLMDCNEAINLGAMALFGEKYDNEVRVVSMGNSVELCGGTHVDSLGDIGYFKIIGEESIASGIRRIEAVTGAKAINYAQKIESEVKNIAVALKCSDAEIFEKVQNISQEKRLLEKELNKLRLEMALQGKIEIEKVGGTNLLIKELTISPKELKDVANKLMPKLTDGILLLSTVHKGRVSLMVQVTKDLSKTVSANDLIKAASTAINAKGGGRAEMAQAGGDNPEGVAKAIELVKSKLP